MGQAWTPYKAHAFHMKKTLFALLAIFVMGAAAQELEEIVVTAQKRSQPIQEVGMSIGVMSGDDVAQALRGGSDILALASRLPSFHVESSNGRLAPRLYVRGLGNIDFDLNASQPVSFVLDEVVLENPAAKSFPLFDIERLELLRGPQGTLFGRNTTGGILKFDSNKPTSERLALFSLNLGARDHLRTDLVFNGPVKSIGAKMRMAFMANTVGDWIHNVAPGFVQSNALGGFEDYAFRLLAAFNPTQQWDLLLNLHGRQLEGTPTIFYGNAIQQGSSRLVAGFSRKFASLDAFDQHFQRSKQLGLFATLNFHSDLVSVHSVTGIHSVLEQISRGDVDGGYGSVFGSVLPSGPGAGIPFDAQTADSLDGHIQITQELRVEGRRGNRFWRVGFYMFHENLEIETFNFDTVFAPHTQNGYVHQDQKTRAYALFGSLDLISEQRLDISSGLRISSDQKEFEVIRTQSPLSFLGIGAIGPLRTEPGDTVLTWDLTANYDIAPDVVGYARLAKGHRAPAIQGRLLFQDEISVGESETSLSVEVGVKALALSRRLRIHGSVYRYGVDDFQLTKIGGAGNVNELINADLLLGYGTEWEIDWFVNQSWLVTAGASLNLTEIDDSTLSVNGCGSATLLYGCTVTDPKLPSGEHLIHGNSLYNAPERILNLSVHYERPSRAGTVEFSTDWAYRSSLRFTLYESLEYADDGATEGGARLGIRFPNERHTLSVYVRNLLNDRSMIGSIDFNNLAAMLNAPRTWGIEYRHVN